MMLADRNLGAELLRLENHPTEIVSRRCIFVMSSPFGEELSARIKIRADTTTNAGCPVSA